MKKLILACTFMLSASAFAETDTMIFPRIYNYGSSVTVSIWNHTDRSVNCSGFLNFSYQSGVRESEYFWDNVMAKFTSYRNFYSRRMNDRITNVSHSISCF